MMMMMMTGFVKNSRRSSVAPHRLNSLCFVHNSYNYFLFDYCYSCAK